MATLTIWPPGLLRIGIGYRVHRVVVILGVGRIDGDERNVAPIFAAGECEAGARGFGFVEHGAGKRMRNVVGVDGDQADGALALERAEPLNDGAGRQAQAGRARATSTATRSPSTAPAVASGGNVEFAAELLLVDRHQPAAAAGQAAENSEHATAWRDRSA